jgi:hypothetical protein
MSLTAKDLQASLKSKKRSGTTKGGYSLNDDGDDAEENKFNFAINSSASRRGTEVTRRAADNDSDEGEDSAGEESVLSEIQDETEYFKSKLIF